MGVATTRRFPRWIKILLIVLGLLIAVFAVLALLPVPTDPKLPKRALGVGAGDAKPSWTGLSRFWPKLDHEVDPAAAELGYLLFFDPILSDAGERSCATCHHPDWGFSEPLPTALDSAGQPMTRHTPTLWNAAYREFLFWDGRATSLEEQALISIESSSELSQSIDDLVARIDDVPEYRAQFNAVYNDGVTAHNIVNALAEFERTLISDGSAFDRFAEGDTEALTAQQRRGLTLFRSAATRCFECHPPPTFTDDTFSVIGVPDEGANDRGRGDVASGEDFAFLTPTLRNAALRGPFMHNGSQMTLEEVVAFYAEGGSEFDLADVDRRMRGFTLSEDEESNLIAFMHALIDETLPEVYWSLNYVDEEGRVMLPSTVPSGLSVVQTLDNPGRARAEAFGGAPTERPSCASVTREGDTLIVHEGQRIQSAVDCAQTGETVLVEPGIYHEQVVIDQNGITLRGMGDEPEQCPIVDSAGRFPEGDAAPNWPILDGDLDGDGDPDLADGVIVSGNDFVMEQFIVKTYSGNGVLAEGVTNVTIRHLFASDTGLYGAYPLHVTNVLIECTVSNLILDAAIYVGGSQDIIVRNNLAYESVAGIEIENSLNADVYNNEAWGNTAGILVFYLPSRASHISSGIRVYDNYVHDNNRQNTGLESPVGAIIKPGTGIHLLASDDSEVYGNRVENNDSVGVAITSMYHIFEPQHIPNLDGPLPERNHVYDNTYLSNGTNPDSGSGFPGVDIMWDGLGSGNRFDDRNASQSPFVLPRSTQPDFVQRIFMQLWSRLLDNNAP